MGGKTTTSSGRNAARSPIKTALGKQGFRQGERFEKNNWDAFFPNEPPEEAKPVEPIVPVKELNPSSSGTQESGSSEGVQATGEEGAESVVSPKDTVVSDALAELGIEDEDLKQSILADIAKDDVDSKRIEEKAANILGQKTKEAEEINKIAAKALGLQEVPGDAAAKVMAGGTDAPINRIVNKLQGEQVEKSAVDEAVGEFLKGQGVAEDESMKKDLVGKIHGKKKEKKVAEQTKEKEQKLLAELKEKYGEGDLEDALFKGNGVLIDQGIEGKDGYFKAKLAKTILDAKLLAMQDAIVKSNGHAAEAIKKYGNAAWTEALSSVIKKNKDELNGPLLQSLNGMSNAVYEAIMDLGIQEQEKVAKAAKEKAEQEKAAQLKAEQEKQKAEQEKIKAEQAKVQEVEMKPAAKVKAPSMIGKKTFGQMVKDHVEGDLFEGQGAIVVGKDGERRSLRWYPESSQSLCEAVAAKVYERLNVNVLSPTLVTQDGTLGVAFDGVDSFSGKKLEGNSMLDFGGLTKNAAKELLHGFAADLLLGVSSPLSGVHVNKDLAPVRMTNGLALLYNGTDVRKPEESLQKVPALDALPIDYGQILEAAGVTSLVEAKAVLKQQMGYVQALYDETDGFKTLIPSTTLVSAKDRGLMLKMLQSRFLKLKAMVE